MSYKKPQVIKLGFSNSGEVAYCDVVFEPQGKEGLDAHSSITVKVFVPVNPSDTLEKCAALQAMQLFRC
jgi:hypothetical protein